MSRVLTYPFVEDAEPKGAPRLQLPTPAAGSTPLLWPTPPVPLDLETCLLSGQGLTDLEIPKRPRLLGDFLCEGDLGYIYAPRGVGKTWLAMALPAALAQQKALGRWRRGEKKAQVLYVDGEMPLELTQNRVRGLGCHQGDVAFLHHDVIFSQLDTSLNIAQPHHRQAITDILLGRGFNCVILDNLSSLATGVDENKGTDYEEIACWLLDLRRRRITAIVVHHAGRNGLMRGHSKREDACSWIIELRDAKAEGEEGAKFISHFAKPSRNTGEAQPDLLWHFRTRDESVQIECELAEHTEFDSLIQHVRDGVDSVGDLADMMGKYKGTISKWVKRAVGQGLLKKAGPRVVCCDEE